MVLDLYDIVNEERQRGVAGTLPEGCKEVVQLLDQATSIAMGARLELEDVQALLRKQWMGTVSNAAK